MTGLLDYIFGGSPQNQPTVPTVAPQSQGFLGGQVDPRMLMDLGIGILAANKPSLTPTNLGATVAGGYGYMRDQQAARADQDYKNAMSQAAMAKANKFDLKSKGPESIYNILSGKGTPEDYNIAKAYDLDRTTQIGSRYNPETEQTEYYPKYQSVIPSLIGAGNVDAGPAMTPPVSPPPAPAPAPVTTTTPSPLPSPTNTGTQDYGSIELPAKPNTAPIDGKAPVVPIAGAEMPTPQIPDMQIAGNLGDGLPDVVQTNNLSPRQIRELQTTQLKTQMELNTKEANDKRIAQEQFSKNWPEQKAQMRSIGNVISIADSLSTSPWATGAVGSLSSNLPWTEGGALATQLAALKDKTSRDTLINIRKQGFAPGSITEKEWGKFETVYGTLDQAQPDVMPVTLNNLKGTWGNVELAGDLEAANVPPEQVQAILAGNEAAISAYVLQSGKPVTVYVPEEVPWKVKGKDVKVVMYRPETYEPQLRGAYGR